MRLVPLYWASQVALVAKNMPAGARDIGDRVRSLGQEDHLEEMASHSSILAWRIPWTEEPGGLQSIGSQRVGHHCRLNTHTRPYTRDPSAPPYPFCHVRTLRR